MNISKALEYTILGYSIIPIAGKRPLVNWEEYQVTAPTEEKVHEWSEVYQGAGIGIVTGKVSGITVVDIDVKNTEKTSLSTFPPTYTVQTPSGGYHLYYQYSDTVGTSANQFPQYPYVDIRNDGGYVVAPPSEGYTIIKHIECAPFPTDLFKLKSQRKKGLKYLTDVGEGGRNNSMASVIGSLLVGLPEDKWVTDAYPVAIRINATYKPPLSAEELKTIFESIAAKEKQTREKAVPSPLSISVDERIDINLRKNKAGMPHKDMVNVLLVLQQHPQFRNSIKYNIFTNTIEFNGELLGEKTLLEIQTIIQDSLLPGIAKQIVNDGIQQHAFNNSYDEVIDWMKSIEWDGEKRLYNWLPRVTHLEETAYTRSVGAQWFLGMVRRLVHPGCVFDHVLVLVGPQGVGKTSLFRIIGGKWYTSYSGGLDNKDFQLLFSGAIIIDLDEGVTMYKSESIKMKSIISQTVDKYRAPYAQRPEEHKRRFVFSMSTNDMAPLKDVTGNRRYWPVQLGEEQVDFEWLIQNRDQLFAEAYHAITQNIKHEEVPLQEALQIQQDNLTEDEWTETIMEYLKKSKAFCEGDPEYDVTIAEIYTGALKGIIDKLERKHEIRISPILRNAGMERVRIMRNGERLYRYKFTKKRSEELQKNPLKYNDF